LMKITFQNMFPPLNVNTVKLTDCRRIVLFDYDAATGLVEERHFAIRAAPSELHKSIKRLVQTKIPSLGDMTDIRYVAAFPPSLPPSLPSFLHP